jgi:hypothetical protein
MTSDFYQADLNGIQSFVLVWRPPGGSPWFFIGLQSEARVDAEMADNRCRRRPIFRILVTSTN